MNIARLRNSLFEHNKDEMWCGQEATPGHFLTTPHHQYVRHLLYSVIRLPPAGMVKRKKPPFARRVQTTAIV
jgi:hypothetical protein